LSHPSVGPQIADTWRWLLCKAKRIVTRLGGLYDESQPAAQDETVKVLHLFHDGSSVGVIVRQSTGLAQTEFLVLHSWSFVEIYGDDDQ
jgi:hypothetical protein